MKCKFTVCLTLILMLLASCKEDKPHHSLIISGEFRNGDLLFRCGYGMESRSVTIASKDIYSHVGILWYDSVNNAWMAVHAVPGEAPKGEKEYLKCEPLSSFFDGMRAEKGAWARVKCPDEIASAAAEYCIGKVKAKVVFDEDYDLKDTTKFYCTELIFQAYLHQGIDLTNGVRETAPPIISTDTDCIYPSTILNGGKIDFMKKMKESN